MRRLLETGLNTPRAHGAGRAFDAAGALALGRGLSRHEGQIALALDNAGGGSAADAAPYPFDLDTAGPVTEVDLRPLWRALAADVIAGAAPAIVSARFHAALVRAGVELVQRASRATGRLPVVLTGGCFQNARLAEGILAGLSSFEVYPHGQVPPGDGGIALGQALVADARARP